MSKYKIVADSCCEVTPEMIGDQDTALVPFSMTVQGKTYVDDEKLDIPEFLAAVQASPTTPKSGHPTPYDFEEAVGEAMNAFIITISSKLSGTYDSAIIAAKNIMEKMKNAQVKVFDAKSAAAGETLIYLKLKEYIKEDLGFENIGKKMDKFIKSMNTIFVLENLDNLVKNGRMSKIAGTIATFLSIHPILCAEEGEINLCDNAVGMKKALNKLVDTIGQVCTDVSDRILVITHCNNPERAQWVKQKVESKYQFKQIYINETKGLGTMYANDGGVILSF